MKILMRFVVLGLVILLVPTQVVALVKYPELEIKQRAADEGSVVVDLLLKTNGNSISGVSMNMVYDITDLKLLDYQLADTFPTVIVEPTIGETPTNLIVAIAPETEEVKTDSVIASFTFATMASGTETEVSLEDVVITSLASEENLVSDDYGSRFQVVLSNFVEKSGQKQSIFLVIFNYISSLFTGLLKN
ncbi:hypothetical protein COT87_00710 [Candidatus Collierbacteria bacterium CG10_big_fil_rev_8_21_14_0_10_44_9]|uniref:Cohesin domain-containing protein n=1 Tax=Candidatus Collierbacteria bacterium CG10_big_fil_rev_8_21_14_0_10_44_9 TaxID=1974535 RepID=A0A2H0VJD2_9BACT|nr:MAG: hypothetical protein COT87_00710 [Candidatus Collierbacteria bacterium CG10_big_fil_rev_8_21_14_0_10_44_9]